MAAIFYLGGMYEMSADMCKPIVPRDEIGLPVWMNGEAGGGDSSGDELDNLFDAVDSSSSSGSDDDDDEGDGADAGGGDEGGD